MLTEAIRTGLMALTREGRRHPDIMLPKVSAMQEIYLRTNSNLYLSDELDQIRYFQKSIAYKFRLVNMSLEQLWSASTQTDMTPDEVLSNVFCRLDTTGDGQLLVSFALECFVLISRSFLDFYMLYICLLLRTGHRGSMSKSKFFKALRSPLEKPFDKKAKAMCDYFQTHVFCNSESLRQNNWGSLLKSIRDKIAHRDRLRTFPGQSPIIQGKLYEEFCQIMQNGMFYLIQKTTPVLFDLEWKSGLYHEGMWD